MAIGAGALAILALAACGGKVTYVTGTNGGDAGGGGGGGQGGFACESVTFDADVPVEICGTDVGPPSCTLEGALADGRKLKEVCSGSGSVTCELFVDGVKSCTCPAKLIDFANTCQNGVATCSAWKLDFADATFCF